MTLNHAQIAWCIARDLPEGAVVNLGSGMPLLIPDHVPADRAIVFHAGNGLSGGGVHQAEPPTMGHVDISVLGACEVSGRGDLAIRHLPAAGGAMEPATGAKQIFAMMELFTKEGRPRLVPDCSLPLTGQCCITRVYTDLAVFELGNGQVMLSGLVEGITLYTLQAELDVELQVSPSLRLLQAPVLS